MSEPIFESFGKIPRLSRDIIITEKIDGTNSQIYIDENNVLYTGSRNQWITPEKDNFGFARWAKEHEEELVKTLGIGRHYGEWWGSGIGRRYNLKEKRFSLFNTTWLLKETLPSFLNIVPVLYRGPFSADAIYKTLAELQINGSLAAPGFMNPEGIIIFHTASRSYFKKTLEKDEKPKGSNE